MIPCRDQGCYLAEAIDSALHQTVQPIEVIVVNDGSTDETAAVAATYEDRIVYRDQPPMGVASARNTGIEAAQGRYLLFLDADDLLTPDAVARMAGEMDGRNDYLCLAGFRRFVRSADLYSEPDQLPSDAASWYRRVFEIDPLLVHRSVEQDGPLRLLPYLLYTNFGPPHCWMSAREMVVGVGRFDEALSGCADWDLWLRLALAGLQLHAIQSVTALYRTHAGTLSQQLDRMLEDRARVLLKAMRRHRQEPAWRYEWDRHLVQAAYRVRRRFIAHGVDSPLRHEIAGEIRRLRPRALPALRNVLLAAREMLVGDGWDHMALSYYRQRVPDLWQYYRADID